ncbi:hydroxylamine reductase [Luteococcus sp. OSA5]|uniref:hydroxylamine reductase n=1 Tax=Luteococcus sp. OSA5 TaxID=3401630 RepID=UPI003B43CD48
MFCYQCEQTDRSDNLLLGCHSIKGNCGKDDRTATLQDILITLCEGIGQYAVRLRELGQADQSWAHRASYWVFTTLTNVNFNATTFQKMIGEAAQLRDELKQRYEQACLDAGQQPVELKGAAQFMPATGMAALLRQAPEVRVDANIDVLGADVTGVRNLNLYGLKGVCAYAHHAHVLGYRSDETDAGIEQALAFLGDPATDLDTLLAHALEIGQLNFKVMAMLDAANTGVFGNPVPTQVRVTPVEGKAVLVSGHDLGDLVAILEATKDTGINVYTHGEMLPAHGYPGLNKYPHLAGNYGSAWQNQHDEFAAFPGPIVMTSNCLIEPQPSYRSRIFTMGPVGWPGVRHLEHKDLGMVVKAAKALPGFTVTDPERTITVGFGHDSVLSHADAIVEAVKAGDISRFLVIGGCDGAKPGRNYYTEIAEKSGDDTILLTMGCNKFRVNGKDYGTVAGLPRLLDVGQCNDSFTAVKVALALAEAFDCGVNDLPLSLFISWFEQKAAAVLLTLLALDIKHIRLGPTLPVFLTPAVVEVLSEKFALKPLGDPTEDLQLAMAGA